MPFEVRSAVVFFSIPELREQVAVTGEVYDFRRDLLQLRGAHVKENLL